ncbi:hypothetical protein [Enemella sp. A6]|uniref:hypothetical protein n=1 Tax=Enemella sp. A6 TaxID=3440152 RepID=UPI003EBAF9C6
MNDLMELVLSHARAVVRERGQAAPVDDHTIRVTYAGGGFHLLDIAGFDADADPDRVRRWVDTMLSPASGLVPEGLLPVIWAERGAPEDAFTAPIGVGLVIGVLRDGEPVGVAEAASWGAQPEEIITAARRELAAREFTPIRRETEGRELIMLEQPAGSANAWALFPTLLKSATGVDERSVVFIPDPEICCVVPESAAEDLAVAQQWAAVRYAKAQRPVSPAAYVMDGKELVRHVG